MYGDHTPLALSDSVNLTPLGANQMYDQGAAFRSRYVRPLRYGEYVGIVAIKSKTIDNSQLYVETSTDGCSSTSAIAFMQGLYPPFPHTTCDLDIPEHTRFANGSILNYPMYGYQYPSIRTTAPDRDPDSIWSRGHGLCNKHENSLLMFANNSMVDAIHQETKVFYSILWDRVFCEAFPRSQANFYNAHDLYDYAAYRWSHDNKTRSSMTSGDLEKLRDLAWQEQTLKHGTVSGWDNTRDDLTTAIAGRTLASRAAALFAENIESHGARNKLNLAFTSHEPFLGFFALTDLTTGPSSRMFSRLPDPGATLTFELFSIDAGETADLYHDTNSYESPNSHKNADPYDTAESYNAKASRGYNDESAGSYNDQSIIQYEKPTSLYNTGGPYSNDVDYPSVDYPSVDNLYVRFLYRSETLDPSSPFIPYSLFGSGHSSMSFKHFNATMWNIGIANATSWCNACESDAYFCKGAEPRHKHHHLLAGLLGSAAALLAVSLVLLLINLLT